MGLFSRTESDSGSGRRTASRPSLSSEAQANELRGRARRRLIGALALVLAAVIVLPMLFDSPIPPEQVETPVVVPAITPPGTQLAANTPLGNGTGADELTPDATGEATPDGNTNVPGSPDPAGGGVISSLNDGDATGVALPPVTPESPTPAPAAPEPKPAPVVETPKPAAPPKPEAPPKPAANTRTDDGSVALALLEGREPPKTPAPAAATKGNFILQIAAYTSDQDAQSRRQRLVSAGVTNAYVETAASGGKTAYRLRVGPFPTREAAQAAQARLRALGYDNGFISSR
jgi:DedD protein